MKLLVLKENANHENRVALTPDLITKYQKLGVEVFVESKAGEKSGVSDSAYEVAGAKISQDVNQILPQVDAVVSVQRTDSNLLKVKPNLVFLALLYPAFQKEKVAALVKANISAFALELTPRITRAQSMDVLSSQSNLSGYVAVLEAVHNLPKVVPMMMTAA